jgi:CRISPR-associated protein Cas1
MPGDNFMRIRKKAEEQGEWGSRTLRCPAGPDRQDDCIKRRNGEQIPFEHKRGYSAREGKKAAAWKADRIQVVAYAMLLEKHLGKPVSEARIRYHADGQTVVIAIDDAMRNEVMSCIERAREIRTWTDRPPICGNDRLCLRCSLAPACLPEEERLLDATEEHPVRLFPPNRERLVVHVTTRGP